MFKKKKTNYEIGILWILKNDDWKGIKFVIK